MTFIGCRARIIEVSNDVLYIVTRRQGSLSSSYCQKERELEIRAEAAFHAMKLLRQYDIMCLERMPFDSFLLKLLRKDKRLFNYYYKRKITEIYPSKRVALNRIKIKKGWFLNFILYLYVHLYACVICCIPFKFIEKQP